MTDQLVCGDLLTRGKVIDGLRQAARYLEDNPGVPVAAFGWELSVYPQQPADDLRRAEVDRIAALLGVPVADDTVTGGHYMASRTFGLVTYRAVHVPAERRAAHAALMSYEGCVTATEPGRAEVTA